MKFGQIIEKKDAELEQFLVSEHQALATLRVDMRTKKVSNVKEIQVHKKNIAKAMTVLRQREITASEAVKDQESPVQGENNG
ncbi:MAG: 50S ribosomal protein L29 [Candidatus Saccharimonadia bacterium]